MSACPVPAANRSKETQIVAAVFLAQIWLIRKPSQEDSPAILGGGNDLRSQMNGSNRKKENNERVYLQKHGSICSKWFLEIIFFQVEN